MINMKNRWLFLVSIVLLAACSNTQVTNEALNKTRVEMQIVDTNRPLSKEDVDLLQKQAAQGSGASAYKLSMYYMTTKQNAAEHRYWLIVSAENGFPIGMYSLGICLRNGVFKSNDKEIDRIRGQFWIERARDAGYEVATH